MVLVCVCVPFVCGWAGCHCFVVWVTSVFFFDVAVLVNVVGVLVSVVRACCAVAYALSLVPLVVACFLLSSGAWRLLLAGFRCVRCVVDVVVSDGCVCIRRRCGVYACGNVILVVSAIVGEFCRPVMALGWVLV